MTNNSNLVQKFLKNECVLDYRAGIKNIDTDLAIGLIALLGGHERFINALPVVKSVGVEDIYRSFSDDELLGFFYCNSEKLIHEMSLIGQSIGSNNKTALDYILNNTDCEYSKAQIEQALEDGINGMTESDDISTEICKWVVYQATSELCANFREFQEKSTAVN